MITQFLQEAFKGPAQTIYLIHVFYQCTAILLSFIVAVMTIRIGGFSNMHHSKAVLVPVEILTNLWNLYFDSEGLK